MRDNGLKSYRYVHISLKMYSNAYSSWCSNELIIVARWKRYKTPTKVCNMNGNAYGNLEIYGNAL